MERGKDGDIIDSRSELSPPGSEQNAQPSSNDHHSMDPPITLRKVYESTHRPDGEMAIVSEGSAPQPEATMGQSVQAKCNSRLIWSAFGGILLSLFLTMSLLYYWTCWRVTPKADLQAEPEVRLMMLGKSGAGKSATGNTILGRIAFRAEASPVSVTRNCQRWTEAVEGRKITVIDTPPIMDTWLPFDQESDCVRMASPGPHAILLVIRVGRFTEEEMNTVKWIKDNFGEEALMFTMVLFTGGDLLEGKSMKGFLNESVELQKLLHLFGGRYHVINNREAQNVKQVSELLNKVDEMTFDHNAIFNISTISQKWRNTLRSSGTEDEEKCKEKEREIREEEEKKREEDRKEIREAERRRREMKVRDVREEEEWKRLMMERDIRKEEEAKRKKIEENLEKQKKKSWWEFFPFFVKNNK